MQKVDIKFTPVSSVGERPQTGGGRFINAIGEQLEDSRVLIKRAPGLDLFMRITGATNCRGMLQVNATTLMVIMNDRVVIVAGSTFALAGVLPGSDIVTIAKNNAATPDIVCVSPANGAFTITAAGVVSTYPDPDVGSPNSVCFTGGYFFFSYGDGTCQASDLNSTNINTLNKTKAESHSRGLLRVVAYRGQAFLCGPTSIEPWQGDQPNATGFPFNRSTVIETGLYSRYAITGMDEGFSPALIWAAPTNHIYMLRGYEPFKISTPTIERDLENLSDPTTLRAFVCSHQGHLYVVFKSPRWTHVYDMSTSTWQERRSYLRENWRGEQSVFFQDKWIIGADDSGDLFTLDAETFAEGANPLIWHVESQVSSAFPERLGVKRGDFEFVVSTMMAGDGVGPVDPQALISWSDNGGRDWGVPVQRSLGKIGRYDNRVSVLRAGHVGSHGRKWRIVVSDAAYVGLLGATMYLEK